MSYRAGGEFWITDTALAMIENANAAALSRLIFEENFRGTTPSIHSWDLDALEDPAPLGTAKVYNNFISAFSFVCPEQGDDLYVLDLYSGKKSNLVEAAIECATPLDGAHENRIQWLWQQAVDRSHIQNNGGHLSLTLRGWEYVENLGLSLNDSDQIFVAMWFGTDEQTRLYREAIVPAITAAGVHAASN